MKALGVLFCSGVLCTSCSHVGGPSPTPAMLPNGTAPSLRVDAYPAEPAANAYKLLYSFKGMFDGADPQSGLIDVNGELYGTTYEGGTKMGGVSGEGTVYRVDTSGHERVIHRFKLGSGGRFPTTGLVNIDDTLYGTTESSEYGSDGTVFSVSASGRERTVYRFNYSIDGAGPQGLIAVKRELYGTMMFGTAGKNCGPPSAPGCGTLFAVVPNGAERLIYTFANAKDGQYPSGHPIYLNGTLYGAAAAGGKNGFGAIFAVTPAGKERVVYSFKGVPDGRAPQGVIAEGGVLYGTTELGGSHNLGTVFRVTTGGQERVLHSFKGPADGANPHDGAYPFAASLVAVRGTLYGTTPDGGIGGCRVGSQTIGCGTVFAVTPSGAEHVLYRFTGGTDSAAPYAGLTYLGGRLYGTTTGFNGQGGLNGTVFSVTP